MSFPLPLSSGATTYTCSICNQVRTQSSIPWARYDSITNLFVCQSCAQKMFTEGVAYVSGAGPGDRLSSGHPATYFNPGSPAPSNKVPGNKQNVTPSLNPQNELGQPTNVVQQQADPTSKAVDLVNG